jgi:hypothetical protein
MRRFTLTALTVATLAIAPSVASAQSTGQQIPTPDPILTKLGHTPMVELWDGGGGLPYLGSSTSYNAGDWENTLRQYHDSGTYDKQLAKVDKVAERWISRNGRGHAWGTFKMARTSSLRARIVRTHHHNSKDKGLGGGKGKKRAIVFDIDETALSNYSAIDADNFTFGTNSKAETTNETGKAIAATLELYNLAQKKGITTFFITGRGESPDNRSHTEHNLTREGYANWKQLFLKPAGFTGTTTDYKSGARQQIEKMGYRIIANVGDQYSDLAGGHSAVAFKLPNPFYFLP